MNPCMLTDSLQMLKNQTSSKNTFLKCKYVKCSQCYKHILSVLPTKNSKSMSCDGQFFLFCLGKRRYLSHYHSYLPGIRPCSLCKLRRKLRRKMLITFGLGKKIMGDCKFITYRKHSHFRCAPKNNNQ